MSRDANHRIVRDATHGYRRLDPLPSEEELGAFYQSEYFHLLRKGGRAPELRRLLRKDATAARERTWLEHTLYADVSHVLTQYARGRRVLEVGCGTGQLLAHLGGQGFEVQGVEPALEAAEVARGENGVTVHHGDLESFWRERFLAEGRAPFDAVLMMNVLEHVADPHGLLSEASKLLAPEGLVCVRVPNDFNALQAAAQEQMGADPWWVAIPDHVHYFDYESLESLLDERGFDLVHAQGDYPMELFLLAGRNYVSDPEAGNVCHQERVDLEMGWPPDSRRRFYQALARAGLGRNCLLFARKRAARIDMQALRVERDGYRYVGLRHQDIQALRGFRNAQLPVLRQARPLSVEDQERWYRESVRPAHAGGAPAFLLVSILDDDGKFLGYGGLTHIDWEQRRAEVSFLVDPARASDPAIYERDLRAFLGFLQGWALGELGLHRLFTETYAFRDHHLSVLESAGFQLEGRMRDHVVDSDSPSGFGDSLLHALVAPGRI